MLTERQSFVASRELRDKAAVLEAENTKITRVFGDRITTALASERDDRQEKIDAFRLAADLIDINAGILAS